MGRSLRLLTEDVEGLKEELSELQVCDIFTFGDYYGPIEWRVLYNNHGHLLAISKDCLERIPFDVDGKDDWETSSLKNWLNNTFYNNAFDSEEKSLIENTSFGKVFCLSEDEAETYFYNRDDRISKEKGGYTRDWWLRSSRKAFKSDIVAAVGSNGSIYGEYADFNKVFVRPVIKLKI